MGEKDHIYYLKRCIEISRESRAAGNTPFGALLTGLGLYDDIARFAGAGSLVPITGFANSVVSPALEFKTEGYVTGLAVKIFTIAGPVIVFGISASVIYGLILCILGVV